jgi:hypothetical protein
MVFKRSSIPPRTAGRWPRAQRWPEPLVVLFVDVVIIIRRFLPRYEETRWRARRCSRRARSSVVCRRWSRSSPP